MTEQRNALMDVKADDRVWVGDSRLPNRVLRTVEKVTAKQIILTVRGDRYRREDGYATSASAIRITGVATPEECEAWDAEQAEAKKLAADRREEGDRRDALRAELSGLFGDLGECRARGLYNLAMGLEALAWVKLAERFRRNDARLS